MRDSDTRRIAQEIKDTIEDKIQELYSFDISEEDVSQAMLKIIRTLLSEWTLPDDRKEMLQVEETEEETLSINPFTVHPSTITDWDLNSKVMEEIIKIDKYIKNKSKLEIENYV